MRRNEGKKKRKSWFLSGSKRLEKRWIIFFWLKIHPIDPNLFLIPFHWCLSLPFNSLWAWSEGKSSGAQFFGSFICSGPLGSQEWRKRKGILNKKNTFERFTHLVLGFIQKTDAAKKADLYSFYPSLLFGLWATFFLKWSRFGRVTLGALDDNLCQNYPVFVIFLTVFLQICVYFKLI